MISFEKFTIQDDVDKYNMLLHGCAEIEKLQQENKKLREKYKATNKGLIKVLSKRLKWKRRYYKEKYIRKELKKWLEEIQQEEFDINGFTGVCTEIRIQCVLDKIKELEGDIKDER